MALKLIVRLAVSAVLLAASVGLSQPAQADIVLCGNSDHPCKTWNEDCLSECTHVEGVTNGAGRTCADCCARFYRLCTAFPKGKFTVPDTFCKSVFEKI